MIVETTACAVRQLGHQLVSNFYNLLIGIHVHARNAIFIPDSIL